MEARCIRPLSFGLATVLSVLFCYSAHAQFDPNSQHAAQSQNFIVFASSPQLAARVSEAAEGYRSQLATYWLGGEIPAWSQRCPIHVKTSPRLGAGGETRFSLMPQGVGNWMMSVQGTEQRVLDSVLPHEITHTIFATHFAKFNDYVPRWADEGACTTVEHPEEKGKHVKFLQDFLRTGRGIPFNRMFSLKDYPHDILPLYAQGHSVVQFLLDQGGPRKFVSFIEDGMAGRNWQVAMQKHYKYQSIGELQMQWNRWLKDGSPKSLAGYAPSLEGAAGEVALASADVNANSNVRLGAFERRTPPADQVAQASPLAGLENASYAKGESWYRDRLRAVSSQSQNNLAAVDASAGSTPSQEQPKDGPLDLRPISKVAENVPSAAASAYALQAYQASRQSMAAPQRNSVQVLDWGNSPSVPGLANQPEMVPLMR